MTAREMHYDFKQKLNKIDSQAYRNLLVPEIDWKLNEAQEIFVKAIAEPRIKNGFGFETGQRTIDDIRTLVINQSIASLSCLVVNKIDDNTYYVNLPSDYWFHVSSKVYADKGTCTMKVLNTIIRQHDDRFEVSPFDKSSFEWREVNIRFYQNRITIFTDGTFEPKYLCLDYIKKPRLIHNAQDFQGGTYTTLTGVVLAGQQSSELPEGTHREIVDLAVLITAGDLQNPVSDIQTKQNKINLTK